MNNVELGNYILKRRKKLNLSQKELADNLFVTVSTISKWEKGIRYPDLTLIGSLAQCLKVDIESFCALKEELNSQLNNNIEFDISKFSNNFKILRKVNNISLTELSNRLNVSYQTISKWENKESLPTIFNLIECSKIFNTSIYNLYYGIYENTNLQTNTNIKQKIKSKQLIINIISFSIISILLAYIAIFTIKSNVNNTAKVTYDFNEFSDDITIIIEKGKPATFYNPNIEGYTLKYYLDDKEYDFTMPVYEDIVLNGVFIINTYTVNFYDQNHNLIKTETVKHNEKATPPTVTSVDEKLMFDCWSENIDNIKTNLDVYPIFINNEADITFNANGGSCAEQYIYDYDNKMYDSLPVANKDGYKFIGWYLENNLFSKYHVVSEPIVLIAKYEPIKFKIYLNSNGGELENLQIDIKYNEKVSLPIPKNKDKLFVGWYLNNKVVDMEFTYDYLTDIELKAMYSDTNMLFDYVELIDSITLLNYKGNSKIVELPSLINGKKVTKLNNDLFINNNDIIELKIPDTINDFSQGVLKPLEKIEKLYVNPNILISLNNLFDHNIPETLKTIEFYGKNTQDTLPKQFFYGLTNTFNIILSKDFTDSIFIHLSEVNIKINELVVCCEVNEFSIYNTGNIEVNKIIIDTELNLFRMTNMISLKEISFIKSIDEIHSFSFENTLNLHSISLPSSINKINEAMFNNSGLKEIIIGNNITTIEKDVFKNCVDLPSITLPNTISYYPTDVFLNCKNLKNVYYDGTIEQWNNIIFENEYSNPLYYGANLIIDGKIVNV